MSIWPEPLWACPCALGRENLTSGLLFGPDDPITDRRAGVAGLTIARGIASGRNEGPDSFSFGPSHRAYDQRFTDPYHEKS